MHKSKRIMRSILRCRRIFNHTRYFKLSMEYKLPHCAHQRPPLVPFLQLRASKSNKLIFLYIRFNILQISSLECRYLKNISETITKFANPQSVLQFFTLAGRNRRQQHRLSCPTVIMELRDIRCTFSEMGKLQHPPKATANMVGPRKGRAVQIIVECG